MNRRDLMIGASGAAVVALAAPGSSLAAADPNDERFMRMAIQEARQGDFPFGTVIVREGLVLARGFNSGIRDGDPTAHGEMNAIRAFLAENGPEELRGTTLYTSGEPCAMCTGAIIWCGIGRVVFGASIAALATRLDQMMITSSAIVAKASFATVNITGGVLSAEALALFD